MCESCAEPPRRTVTMVFGLKPVCDKCGTKETNLWHKDDNDQILCTECQAGAQPRAAAKAPRGRDEDDQDGTRDDDKADPDDHKDADSSNGNGGKDDDQDGDKDKDSGRSSEKRETKRRTRKGRQGGKGGVPKGKGRRYIFKKSVSTAAACDPTHFNKCWDQLLKIKSKAETDSIQEVQQLISNTVRLLFYTLMIVD